MFALLVSWSSSSSALLAPLGGRLLPDTVHGDAPHLSRACVHVHHHVRNTPRCEVQMLAKKGGGKKKGGGAKKKQSGFAWASNFELKPFESTELRSLAETVVSTYQTRTGKTLHASLSGANDVPKKLWSAPIAVVVAAESTDGGGGAEAVVAVAEGSAGEESAVETHRPPVYLYANLAALEAHGLSDDYARLIGQPSELPPTSTDSCVCAC